MSAPDGPRVTFRIVKTAAGTLLVGASVAAITAFSPAPAAPAVPTAPGQTASAAATSGTVSSGATPANGHGAVPRTTAANAAPARSGSNRQAAPERIHGVRADLARAVDRGHVSAEQAESFTAQIQSRIARGL